MKDYKNYQKGFDILAKKQYGQSLMTLMVKDKKDRTSSETNFLRRYRKYSPVIETKCVMNQICKRFETVDNEIKWDKSHKNVLVEFVDFTNIDKTKIEKIYKLIKMYNSRKSIRGLEILADNEGINNEDIYEMFRTQIYTHKDNVRDQIRDLFDKEQEMFNHVMYTSTLYNIKIDIVWEIMGDYIVECIPWDTTHIVIKQDGGKEYLGQELLLKGVD